MAKFISPSFPTDYGLPCQKKVSAKTLAGISILPNFAGTHFGEIAQFIRGDGCVSQREQITSVLVALPIVTRAKLFIGL